MPKLKEECSQLRSESSKGGQTNAEISIGRGSQEFQPLSKLKTARAFSKIF